MTLLLFLCLFLLLIHGLMALRWPIIFDENKNADDHNLNEH